MKKILNIFSMLLATGLIYAQTTSENYIQTRTYFEPVTATNLTAKQVQTIEYFDGLGRPKQIINVKSTPLGNDIVIPIVYDSYGLQVKNFLPIPQNSTLNGNIYAQDPNSVNFPVNDVTNIYQGEKIYSESIIELSPLKKIQQKKQVGNTWSSKPVNFNYETNTASDAIKNYEVTTTWDPISKIFMNSSPTSQTYQINTLYKNSVKDEDGNETITFKNKLGQVILIRRVINALKNADTYYIYNIYKQLVYIVPPLASIISTLDQTTLNSLCYQYKYDYKNRLVEKKLPGKGWEYMVYDNQDRLVMTQDANLGVSKQWLFTKYDQFGRVAFTGIYTSTQSYGSAGRTSEQTTVNAKGGNNVLRTSSVGVTVDGRGVYYDNNTSTSYPTSITKLLSINYYDTYPVYGFNPTFPTSILGTPVITDNSTANAISTKSLPVMSLVKNIEDDNWTSNYTYYDSKGRAIGTHSVNHLGGYTRVESQLDFAGVPQQTVTKHKRLSADTEKVITETFTYDSQNRLLTHTHQVDSNPVEYLAQNTYNEISQVTNKKVGGTVAATPLQSIDYQYNIRGWLTKINDPSATLTGGKLFGYELKYTNPVNTTYASGRYNGNIAEIDWRTSNDDILRRYSYSYDGLNRLMFGHFAEPFTTQPSEDYFGESIEYDLNGNISHLYRNSKNSDGLAMQIDNLTYTYTANRLNTVTDSNQNYGGYPDVSGNIIGYDDNGNMTDHIDKGIVKINYNYLDLPDKLIFDQTYIVRDLFSGLELIKNITTQYLYRADGTKLSKTYSYGVSKNNSEAYTITNYLDGFQYEGQGASDRVPMVLKFVPTAEGYYNFENNKYIYQYKDQVGNVRLAYYKDALGNVVIDRITNYYPFGLEFGERDLNLTNSLSPSYTYAFQGQEKQQETGWSSFKWRNYDPTMGRFFNIDPLSEKYAYQSHYNFSENRIVNSREIEGLEADDNYEPSRFDERDYDGGIDYSNEIETGIIPVDLSWKILDSSSRENVAQENGFDFNDFVSDGLFGLGSDESRDNYRKNLSNYEDLTKKTGADEVERDFYYMFGGALTAPIAAPIAVEGWAALGGIGASSEFTIGGSTIGNYLQGAFARSSIDYILQKSIKGDVDIKQTIALGIAPNAKWGYGLSMLNNFGTSASNGKQAFINDFGKNIFKAGTGFLTMGLGNLGELYKEEGNAILGSYFGTDILPGIYGNTTDIVVDHAYEKK